DVAVLLGTQQVAYTPDLHVLLGQQVTRAQVVELGYGVEPPLSLLCQPARVEHVSPRLSLAPADPAAQLVELRQPEAVGTFDDQGIGTRDVEARLDDRRRQQDVIGALLETDHHLFEVVLIHLAVGNADARFGYQLRQGPGAQAHRSDAVVDVEHLATALQLAQDGLARDHGVVRLQDGLDRFAALWRRQDLADVTQAHEAHVQRARDGSGRQRQHVDVGLDALDALLLPHPEAVLLVDHQQAQALVDDRLVEEPVRADDDVDGAVCQALDCVAGIF